MSTRRSRSRIARQSCRNVLQRGEGADGHAPQQRAGNHERLAPPHAVAPGAHEQRGRRGGYGRSAHHERHIGKRCPEDILDEQVEEVVLHRPRHLAHKSQRDDDDPRLARQSRRNAVGNRLRVTVSPGYFIAAPSHGSQSPRIVDAHYRTFRNRRTDGHAHRGETLCQLRTA